ncbi:ABC transporter permease [Leifsonia poae]|uniref:Membrane protein n=1 Tax=Leifsonia poae TaxID=110933 RepID=A0A9W6H686_9MICO|nr:ABC transporter permease [Leifsonia poae]GLJ74674.1 membrane protein [Leifsonia poae]
MSTSDPRTPRIPHTPWGRAIALAVGAAAIVAVVLLAFVWPTITSTVKDVPIAVAGPSAQVTAVEASLDKAASGAFDVTRVDSRAAAVDLIKTRDVYGAIILGEKPEVLTASANGVAVSQILDQIAGQLQTQANAQAAAAVQQAIAAGRAPAGTVAPTITVTVTDVVPLASTDARGLGLTAASFPLVLGGLLGGILISILVAGSWRRLAAVTTYAVAGGLGIVGIMQGWFGILQGNFWINALAVGLAMFATASFIVGMNALIGRAGIAVGGVLTMLVGNPLSAATQPLQFMVAPWGAIGQWFVPGASATLVRDLSYFPDADTLFPWLVLLAWSAVGVVGMIAGHFRNQVVVEAAVEESLPASAATEDAADRIPQPA